MTGHSKMKKRGFVMTGGGAKGLYEAGVIHAFHITNMEFDVITGSSIGAMNSVFFAEYLFRKHEIMEGRAAAGETAGSEKAMEELDPLVKAYHHAWLLMPAKKVVDDSDQGPLGLMKDDLGHFEVDLPMVTRLGWWWTDPNRSVVPPPDIWPAMVRLVQALVEQLGGPGEVLKLLKNKQGSVVQSAARAYLARRKIDRALVTADQDNRLKDLFTSPITPLTREHLAGNIEDTAADGAIVLVDPARTLREYAEKGIFVRLTRANYRTGRLEISAYVPIRQFTRFLQSSSRRLKGNTLERIPLGSFRMQVPGNPNAIDSGICSGRFPGVFQPFPFEKIYHKDDPENQVLYQILDYWVNDEYLSEQLRPRAVAAGPDGNLQEKDLAALLPQLRASSPARDYFPRRTDVYVDGGTIDNTPTNSAVDFVREWAGDNCTSRRDVELELYVIFLETEPKISSDKEKDPSLFQVVGRTLGIQGAAKRSSDANTIETINRFGELSEQFGVMLQILLNNYRETLAQLEPDKQQQVLSQLVQQMEDEGVLQALDKDAKDDLLGSLNRWMAWQMRYKAPLHVEPVKIYPEEMPMDTLQLTERLGYRKENAIKMITMGCYNTLFTMRNRLEAACDSAAASGVEWDAKDQQVLALVRKWMGVESWPLIAEEQEKARAGWRCQRVKCAFHATHCPHGASGG